MRLVIILSLVVTLAWAKPNLPTVIRTCKEVFESEGINAISYAASAAHGVHNLFLEDIREFFEPNATEDNGIPVLNMHLSSSQPILMNSPLAGYDTGLKVYGSQVVDYIFSHDSPDLIMNGVTTVERLAHAVHMQEMWKKAQVIYQQLKENPPKNAQEVCQCANDIKNNNILLALSDILSFQKNLGNDVPRELIKARQEENNIISVNDHLEKDLYFYKNKYYDLKDTKKVVSETEDDLDKDLYFYKHKYYDLTDKKEKVSETENDLDKDLYFYKHKYYDLKNKKGEVSETEDNLDKDLYFYKHKYYDLKDKKGEVSETEDDSDKDLYFYKHKYYDLKDKKEEVSETEDHLDKDLYFYKHKYYDLKNKKGEVSKTEGGLDTDLYFYKHKYYDLKEKKEVSETEDDLDKDLYFYKHKYYDLKDKKGEVSETEDNLDKDLYFYKHKYYDLKNKMEDTTSGKDEKEIETPKTWLPGTVNSSKGYPLLKTMITGLMMEDQKIEYLAHFLYCKLNY